MAKITGGCLCGAVRYTAEAEAASATVCHCRDCQKFTGSDIKRQIVDHHLRSERPSNPAQTQPDTAIRLGGHPGHRV